MISTEIIRSDPTLSMDGNGYIDLHQPSSLSRIDAYNLLKKLGYDWALENREELIKALNSGPESVRVLMPNVEFIVVLYNIPSLSSTGAVQVFPVISPRNLSFVTESVRGEVGESNQFLVKVSTPSAPPPK